MAKKKLYKDGLNLICVVQTLGYPENLERVKSSFYFKEMIGELQGAPAPTLKGRSIWQKRVAEFLSALHACLNSTDEAGADERWERLAVAMEQGGIPRNQRKSYKPAVPITDNLRKRETAPVWPCNPS